MSVRIQYLAYAMLLPAAVAMAEGKRDAGEPKVISGMSIVGNNETPKSLYIVPWKDAEAGKQISFTSSVMKQELRPLDKGEFALELDLYRLSNPE